jgi:hypothetical protein
VLIKIVIVGPLQCGQVNRRSMQATPRWQFRLFDIAATRGEMKLMVLQQAPEN